MVRVVGFFVVVAFTFVMICHVLAFAIAVLVYGLLPGNVLAGYALTFNVIGAAGVAFVGFVAANHLNKSMHAGQTALKRSVLRNALVAFLLACMVYSCNVLLSYMGWWYIETLVLVPWQVGDIEALVVASSLIFSGAVLRRKLRAAQPVPRVAT